MKIINEKGKLFGIINVIDLAVILIIGVLVVGGTRRLKKKPIVSNESSKAIITYEVPEVRQASVDKVEVGDPIYHYDKGEYIGKIVEVSHVPYIDVVPYEGKWVEAEVPGKYIIKFKIEADVKDSPDFIVAGGEQTRVGAQQRLKNKKIAFFGTVMDMEIE